MIDLHTHIMPGMDDGSPDVDVSIALLELQKQQGVNTVALTPHFYRTSEHPDQFLLRRESAWQKLKDQTQQFDLPELVLGAEVAFVPGMCEWPELEELCYGGTKVLLIELPFVPWNDEIFRQLWNLESRRGIVPMIAHVDRYFHIQKRYVLNQLIDMGFMMQISAHSVIRGFSKHRVLRLLLENQALLVSDCHDPLIRTPNIGQALSCIEKKFGSEAAAMVTHNAMEALQDW